MSKLRFSRALDVASGVGHFTPRILSLSDEVVCADVSVAALRRDRLAPHRLASSMAEIPFADGSFDCLLCMESLYYLTPQDRERALAEFSRVLKPSGSLVVSVWTQNGIRVITGQPTIEEDELREMLRHHGFSVIRRTTTATALERTGIRSSPRIYGLSLTLAEALPFLRTHVALLASKDSQT